MVKVHHVKDTGEPRVHNPVNRLKRKWSSPGKRENVGGEPTLIAQSSEQTSISDKYIT